VFKGHVSSDNSISKLELKIKLAIWDLFLIFISIKIKGDHEFAKRVKLKGPKMLFLNLGDQNRKFVKLRRPKIYFSLKKLSNFYEITLLIVFLFEFNFM